MQLAPQRWTAHAYNTPVSDRYKNKYGLFQEIWIVIDGDVN
jgi:hypothetical protein